MKKRYLFPPLALLLFFVSASLSSQDLHVGASGQLSVASGHALYVNGNLSVDASGSLMINSDATHSGSLIVLGTSTGNITYVRNINDTNWHLVSAPVSGQNIPAFVVDASNSINTNPTTGNYAVAYYNNANTVSNRWVYHNDSPDTTNKETLTTFTNGQGYSLNRTAAGDYSFSGTLATSDVAVSLTTSSGTHYWHCIGNPYPSFLPANSSAAGSNLFDQNSSILDVSFSGLYFWNGSAYEVINNASAALQIAPGQAFMVKAQDESETFTFPESIQNHQSGTATFFRQNNNTPQVIVSVSNESETRTTEIKYFSNTTLGLDVGYDAGAFQDGTPRFAINTHLIRESEGIDFMLQCLPNSDYEDQVVPISVYADANSTISFGAEENNLPQGLDVYLEDRELNTFTKINETAYQVTPENALAGIGRFYLHTTSQALSTDNPSVGIEVINIYKTNNHTLRITGLQEHGRATIKVYDILGKQVFDQTFIPQNVQDIDLPSSLRTGIYIIDLMNDTLRTNKKIIIE